MAHKMLGWGLCILSGVLLTGCERPSVSVSELGRIDYALPDAPELTKPYQLKDLPEEIDIYNHEIKNQDFLKQLRVHGIISSNSATSVATATSEATSSETESSETSQATSKVELETTVKTESAVKTDVAEADVEPVADDNKNVPVSGSDSSASTTPTAPAGDAPPPTDSSRVDSSESTSSDESTPPSQGFEILEETEMENGDGSENAPSESDADTPATPPRRRDGDGSGYGGVIAS